jgi:pimeloyl-ACP methyl ester carboxylesterase
MERVFSPYTEIDIIIGNLYLKGNLRIAARRKGLVIFSHGSGSSRLSSRNNFVADLLLNKGFSSLLFDLLTAEEDKIYDNRFKIPLLTQRLVDVTKWIHKKAIGQELPIGYFGASTGAASALSAAAKLPKLIKAVVCRGGRPDLALESLPLVKAPTLLLVGSLDLPVIELNRKAQLAMEINCELRIIEGATHLFPEQGKLEEVSNRTIEWFNKYLIE